MKETRTYEASVCDVCHKENAYRQCLHCGKDLCSDDDCRVEYRAHGHTWCTDDPTYCKACDAELMKLGTDQLHNACRKLANLHLEWDGYAANWKARHNTASQILKGLLDARKN